MTKNILKKLAVIGLNLIMLSSLATTILSVGILSSNTANAGAPTSVLNNKPPEEFQDTVTKSYSKEITGYQSLTTKSYTEIIASVIKTALFFVSFLTIIGLIVVGVMYMTGSMVEDNIAKAKKILGYLGIGIIVISASYAIVAGLLKINIF